MEYRTPNCSVYFPDQAIVFELGSLYAWLLKLTDGRKRRGIRYPLALLLVMVILAKLGGEDGPKGMAEWLKYRLDFLIRSMILRRSSVPHPVTLPGSD